MNTSRNLVLAMLVLLAASSRPSVAITYTGAGTYSPPAANCGFEVTGSSGFASIVLANDPVFAAPRDIDLLYGNVYPLVLRQITLYGSGQSVVVDTTPSCSCSAQLDPYASPGVCYTRSLIVDECEEDSNRPEVADAEQVAPGPNLSMMGVGFYNSGAGDVDYLTWSQGDYGEYWNTARSQSRQWNWISNGGIRRCRFVDGSANTFLTVVAP